MNRDLLYSLGLALAAWPPLVGEAPNLGPVEPPPAIHASASLDQPERKVLPAAVGTAQPAEAPACAKAYRP